MSDRPSFYSGFGNPEGPFTSAPSVTAKVCPGCNGKPFLICFGGPCGPITGTCSICEGKGFVTEVRRP